MLAYGKLNRDLMAAGFSKGALGFEFAGTSRGERRVMGVAHQAIATSCGAPKFLVRASPAAFPVTLTHDASPCLLSAPDCRFSSGQQVPGQHDSTCATELARLSRNLLGIVVYTPI